MDKVTMTIRLRPETRETIGELCKKHNCTISEYVELSILYMFSLDNTELPEIMKRKLQIEKNPRYQKFVQEYREILEEEGIKVN